jgi:hypothetical protein
MTMTQDIKAMKDRELRDEQLDAMRKAHASPYRLGLDGTKTRRMKPAPAAPRAVATSAKGTASTTLAKIVPTRLGAELKARLKGGAR